MTQSKIVFVVSTNGEAKLANTVKQVLEVQNMGEVFAISTGTISKEDLDQTPDKALADFGIPFKNLLDYETKNIAEILKSEQPGIVIVGSDQEFVKRAFVYAAKGLRIPSLLLQLGMSSDVANVPSTAIKRTTYRLSHYFGNILHKYLYLLRTIIGLRWSVFKIISMILKDMKIAFSTDDARGRFGCQSIAVSSSYEKQVLIKRGVSEDDIFITGSPEFDNLSQLSKKPVSSTVYESLGINKQDKVILLLTSAFVEHGWWSPDMRAEFVTGIIDSMTPLLNESTRLVIKIHPIENLDDYRIIVNQREENVILRKDVALSDVINMSDIIISSYSTTVLEACVLGKPAIILNIFGDPEYLPYVDLGLATGVYNLEKLTKAVEGILYDEVTRAAALDNASKFLNSNKQLTDGKAALRIADLIVKFAGLKSIIPS